MSHVLMAVYIQYKTSHTLQRHLHICNSSLQVHTLNADYAWLVVTHKNYYIHCMHIYSICTHICKYACMQVHVHTHTPTHTYTHAHTHTHTHTHTYTKRLSSVRGKIILPWSCKDHRTCFYIERLNVLHSECPLKEVSLHIIINF